MDYNERRYADNPWEKSTIRHKQFCRGVARRQLMQEWELSHPGAIEAIIEQKAIVIDANAFTATGLVRELDT
jgi:hypothetical protein